MIIFIFSFYTLYNQCNFIKYIKNQSNKGKIASRSEGVKIAKGNYVLLIDGDDSLIHKNILYNLNN